MFDHKLAAVVFNALADASVNGSHELKLKSVEEAEQIQRFITGIIEASGVLYITTLQRQSNSLLIKAER